MLQENQNCMSVWSENIGQIDETTQKLMKIYDSNMQKAEAAYQKLLGMFHERKDTQSSKNQNKEIHRLQEIILEQNRKIADL